MNLLEDLMDIIKENHKMTPIDTSSYNDLKVRGMKFDIKAYEAAGLGHVSTMAAKGFWGLMKMDTLIIVPKNIDLPLFSYDRILAMGNDTLIIELYDTCLEKCNLRKLQNIVENENAFTKYETGGRWYDSIKLPESIGFKGKRKDTGIFDAISLDYLQAFLSLHTEPVTDLEAKSAKSAAYVDGLLWHGGPSTDVFIKSIGKERTTKLFKEILF